MKKIIVIVLLILILTPVFSNTNGETLRLSATVKNVVYIGVTTKALTSSIVPDITINNIGFSFNPNTAKWETHEAYIYVISFVTNALKVTLSASGDGLKRDKGDSGPDSLYYTGTVTAVNTDNNTAMKSITELTTSTNGGELYVESGTFDKARVCSWKLSIVVDPNNLTGTSSTSSTSSTTTYNYIPSGNQYVETFTLSISTVS